MTAGQASSTPLRAAIYSRISRDAAGDLLGVQRQEKACRALCERSGWTAAVTYRDDDRSAFTGRRRPGYEALMEAVRERHVDVVVAWHPDRLHRSPRELEDFIDAVERAGSTVATVQTGAYDLSTPSGRAVARTLGAWARYESEHKSARLKAKHRELAEAGKVGAAGTRPFGYERDAVTLRPTEAALIRDASELILAGVSLRSLVADWNERGVEASRGGPWTSTVIRRILTSPRVAGLRAHNGEVVGPAVWPAVVDVETWAKVCAVLSDPRRRRNGRLSRRYLLTGGLAVCGECDAALVARPRGGDSARCYVCAAGPNFHGCGKIRRLAEPVETEVWARLRARVELALLEPPETGDVTGAGDELALVTAQMETLAKDHYVDGTITRVEFMAARAGLAERADRLRMAIGKSIPVVLDDIDDPDLSFDRRRAILEAFVDRVVVDQAVRGLNRFDPTKIRVEWR